MEQHFYTNLKVKDVKPYIASSTTIFLFTTKPLLLGNKCVFKHEDLQMFGLKLNNYRVIFTNLKLWVAVARHKFIWVEICFFNVALQVLSRLLSQNHRLWLNSIPILERTIWEAALYGPTSKNLGYKKDRLPIYFYHKLCTTLPASVIRW